MMNLNKVLEVLNNGDYVKIEEYNYTSKLCPHSESRYTVTLKEGGMIRITQLISLFGIFYRISLFVPNEEKSVKSWTFDKQRKGWLSRKTIKDSLYDEVSSTFYNLYYKVSQEKIYEYSKYFPQ